MDTQLPKIPQWTEQLIGEYVYYIIIICAIFLFREFLVNAVAGFRFFMSRDFNELDVVFIGDRIARITKVGFSKTTFIFYDKGTKVTIPNFELESLRMEKSLPMADLTQLPDEEDKDGGLHSDEKEKPTDKEMSQGLVE